MEIYLKTKTQNHVKNFLEYFKGYFKYMDIKGIANPEDITPEALDFIYKNAVSYLEAIHKSMESISNRSLLLLSYLMLVVGFTVNKVISYSIFLIINHNNLTLINFIIILGGILLIIHYSWLIWDIVHYSKPRWSNVAYSQPNSILDSELNSYGEHMIKFVRCIELQEDIKEDIIIMTDMFKQFEIAIERAFIFPLIKRLIKK